MALGLMLDGPQAEAILRRGEADLIAIGRAALEDPNWSLTAARQLGADPGCDRWPDPYGWALRGPDAARADHS